MELTEFLLARIAEDEAVARNAVAWSAPNPDPLLPDEYEPPEKWFTADGGCLSGVGFVGDGPDVHIARWSPALVLAECEARRRIVEMTLATVSVSQQAELDRGEVPSVGGLGEVLQFLAMPYADHADYRPEWSALVP